VGKRGHFPLSIVGDGKTYDILIFNKANCLPKREEKKKKKKGHLAMANRGGVGQFTSKYRRNNDY